MKRVLLINPPDTRPSDMTTDKVRIGIVPPLGLAYIAAVLEQNNVEVKILDCAGVEETQYLNGELRYGMTDAAISEAIANYKPDTIGVSCLFSNKYFDAHNVCRIVKEVNPDITTVMGGAHPSAVSKETLRDKNVDKVCIGAGENYWFKISDLPTPARHLLDMPHYLNSQSPHSGQKRAPATIISTSRGCPYNCSFCAIKTMWTGYNARSPENVLAEIEHLINTYGIRELHFEDDNFTADKKRAMAILQGIIDRKFDLTLNSPSGLAVMAMDEELLDKMCEAGFYSVSFAIESGTQKILKLMHKKIDYSRAQRLIKYARTLGMKTKAFYILGYPGETKETMSQTVDMAYQLGADWSLFFPATPLPGTELMTVCQRNNYLVNPNMDYRYYFYKPNIRTPEFDPDYVENLKEEANRQINFEQNINMREGNYKRAAEDFGEVVSLYPHLEFARESLRRVNELS